MESKKEGTAKGMSQFEALVQVRKEQMLNPLRSPSPSGLLSPSTDWTESSSDEEDSDSSGDEEEESSEGAGFVASAQFDVEESL